MLSMFKNSAIKDAVASTLIAFATYFADKFDLRAVDDYSYAPWRDDEQCKAFEKKLSELVCEGVGHNYYFDGCNPVRAFYCVYPKGVYSIALYAEYDLPIERNDDEEPGWEQGIDSTPLIACVHLDTKTVEWDLAFRE